MILWDVSIYSPASILYSVYSSSSFNQVSFQERQANSTSASTPFIRAHEHMPNEVS